MVRVILSESIAFDDCYEHEVEWLIHNRGWRSVDENIDYLNRTKVIHCTSPDSEDHGQVYVVRFENNGAVLRLLEG